MAIRKNLNPRQMDLQPEMRDILMRNGMQAHIIANGDGYQLAVQGHDSPLLTYNLTEKQMLALTDWGTNSANKKAYNIFTSIISKDFYMPRNLVHARNANGRVAMGLHGYRIGAGEYGRLGWSPEFLGWTPRMQDGYQLAVQGHDSPLLTYNLTEKQMLALTDWGTNSANKKAYNVFTSIIGKDFYMPRNLVHARNANGRVAMGLHGYRIGTGEYGRLGWSPEFLGWTPRMQDGYHLRRVGGQMFYAGAPMVAERPDRRLKPGELTSGGYGFYYKGQQQVAPQADVLQNLQAVVTPVETRPRSQEPAKPYKELISSPVYFSNDQWQESLSSHGIIIDEKAKTLTIQSESTKSDMVYDLTDDELKALTNNSVKQVSVAKRLDILNNVIKDDFADKITMDMLTSKERIHIGLRPEVQQELDGKMQLQSTVEPLQVQQEPMNNKVGIVDGQDLDENKGWFREGKHGREVTVGEIRVEPAEQEGKFRMTAIINGERVSHEITQKQYDKFMAVDDYHRMKLFSKIFGEVDMKDRTSLGTKIGAALLAGLGVAAEVGSELHRPHGVPVVIVDHHHGAAPAPPRPYFKPGVDTPMDVAARNFEAAMNQEVLHPHMGKGL